MARILVTGGAGFIGSHIVDRLIQAKNEVFVIDDLSSGLKEQVNKQAKFEKLDIRSATAKEFVANLKPEVIVHAAAQMSVRVSMDDPVLDTQINIVGLVNILDAFRFKNLPRVVFLSTGGAIYGEQQVFPASEEHPCKPNSIYGQAKKVSEIYLEFWAREFGMSFAALRLGNVYGPRQNPHGEAGVVAIFSQILLKKEIPTIYGTGKQTRDFVYVFDVARAVSLAVEKEIEGIYNIGTARESDINKIYEHLSKAANVNRPANYAPAKMGEQMRSCISAKKACDVFGWKPEVSLEIGLESTLNWFKENGRK